MKRVIAALALLLVIAGGCLASYFNEKQHFEQMIALAKQAEEHYCGGDVQAAQQAAERLADAFSKHVKLMALVLPHEALTEVDKSVQGLTLILPYGEPKDFTAESRRCRLLLQRLWDQEQPTWENVL